MEEFVKGDVVVLPFPFSDLSNSKKRPVLIISKLKGDDVILCQITSDAKFDDYAIVLSTEDFRNGNLNLSSMIRPNRLFTGDRSIILYRAGHLTSEKILEVENEIIKIIKS